MAHKISSQTAEHCIQGLLCDRWLLLKRPGLSIIQEQVPVGCGGLRTPDEHVHQVYYVLQGQATLAVDGHRMVLNHQEGCAVPAGRSHRLRNEGSEDLVFLVIAGGDTGETDSDHGTWGAVGRAQPSSAAKT